MRVNAKDLSKFDRDVGPPPPPIEPVLPAAEEAKLIASDSDDPTVVARRARVQTIVRRPATPEGADAELVALLAAARALPLERRTDRLCARQRLVGIGGLREPPPEVTRLMTKFGVAPRDGTAFAEALLARTQDTTPFHEGSGFGSNYPPGS
jgi:hypothetical protein